MDEAIWTRARQIYEWAGETARAERIFHDLVVRFPDSASAYYQIARIYSLNSHMQEAIDAIEQALSIAGQTDPMYYVRAGEVYEAAGETDKALSILDESITLFPGHADTFYAIAHVYRSTDQPLEAINAIEQAIALMTEPDQWFYLRAGRIYEWAEYPDEAKTAYRQAQKINPDNAAAQEGIQRLGEEK